MFYSIVLKRELIMHPSTFGPDLHEKVKEKLREEVEGTVDGRYGFIITITSIDPIPLGQIDESINRSHSCSILHSSSHHSTIAIEHTILLTNNSIMIEKKRVMF
jgi:hypothetical protein